MSQQLKRHNNSQAAEQKQTPRPSQLHNHSLMTVQKKLGLFGHQAASPAKQECHAYLKGKPLGFI